MNDMITLTMGGKTQNFTLAELKKLYARAQRDLGKCIEINQSAIDSLSTSTSPQSVKYIRIWASFAQQIKRAEYVRVDAAAASKISTAALNIAHIKEHQNRLLHFVRKNEEFLARVAKGKLRYADYLIIPISPIKNFPDPIKMTCIHRRLKDVCLECGVSVNLHQMQEHQKTERCQEKAKIKKLAEHGLVATTNYRVVQALKKGAIKGESVPIKWRWYVPAWTLEAAATYERNKGYGGMSFEDFVLRMRPTTEK